MTGPAPSVAAVRVAVRRELALLDADALVLVACSGGPDSLALAAALAFEAPRTQRRAGAVIVDHGWSDGSAQRSAELAELLRGLGLDPVRVVAVDAGPTETQAREVRQDALAKTAAELGAAAILLGHTADDQAEQVLLALARGSGTRSLAGMPRRRDVYRRPLLDLDRTITHDACTAQGLSPWLDPSNADPVHARARVRHEILPLLESRLGPGIAQALKRTADLSRQDADALDRMAAAADERLGELSIDALLELDEAISSRVIKRRLEAAGAAVTASHVHEVMRLATDWSGQGPLQLPGGVRAHREGGRIVVTAPATGRF